MQKHKRGFALIELLVVILIIGILAAVALPQYQKAVLKSRYTQVQVLGRALQDAVNMYYLSNGAYPTTMDGLDIQIPGTLSTNKQKVTSTDKYECYLDVRSNHLDSLWCMLKPDPHGKLLAFRFLIAEEWGQTVGGRYCVAMGTENEEICESLGGTSAFDNGAGYIHYRLP